MTQSTAQEEANAVATDGEFRRSWPTLVFSTIGAGVGLSSLGYILGTLVVPLQKEFGWGRGDINLASLFSSLGLAVALPFVGKLLDRYGVKRVTMVSVPFLVLVLTGLSIVTSSLASFLVLYALAGLLGAGTSAVTYSKAVVEKFNKNRGIALGIVAGGLGTAGLVLPPLMGVVIANGGWRAAYLTMAILAALPFVLVFFARLSAPSTVVAIDRSTLPGLTLRDALRRREFWSLCIVFFLLGWALLTMIPHFVPLLIDSGVNPVQAAFLSSLVGVGTVIARPVIGWLFDRFYATHVAVPLFIAAALGCLMLLWAGAGAAPVTALLIGIGFGAEIDLMSYLSSRYFGPRAFGGLYSLVYSVFMIGSAFGPVFAGFMFDANKSYDIPLIVAATMMAVAAVILLTLPRLNRESSTW